MEVLRPTERVPIDAEPLAVAVSINRLVPGTMHRIKLQQMGSCRSITARIIDMDKLNTGAVPECSKHKPADPAETVDSNAHRETAQNRRTDQLIFMRQHRLMRAQAWRLPIALRSASHGRLIQTIAR